MQISPPITMAPLVMGETIRRTEQQLVAEEEIRSAQVSAEKPRRESRTPRVTRQNIEIDPGTKSIIFQTINEATDTVVRQHPNEVQLRVRAYLATQEGSSTSLGWKDRTA